jgi:TDG/mug DNA glycosylase family protein
LLTREDFAEGRIVLSQKLEEFGPRVVAFNGRLTYEQFAQRKCKFGLQKEKLYGARVFVLPATSGAAAGNKKDAILHFRKLAQLVKKVEKERDSSPLAGNRFANSRTSHSADHDKQDDSGDADLA